MTKHSLLLILIVVFTFDLSAQEEKCHFNHDRQLMIRNQPVYKETFDAIKKIITKNTVRNIAGRSVITIPVVVHIIYHSAEENISNEQVYSQIKALNRDFRKLNPDTVRIPEEFKSIASDTKIEFRLASRDPDGNPSTGITRTYTDSIVFKTFGMAYDSTGGKSNWPRDEYLNIRVANFKNGSTIGSASMPGSPAETDGAVIHYKAFGTIGTAEFSTNKGRTTTHEIGHWLGLEHIFEGGCTGTTASDCGNSGDYICDTPQSSGSNFSCDAAGNTCTDWPVDRNDNTSNYMDYTYDRCMNMFTQGQADRMLSSLNNIRTAILSSSGHVPVVTTDAGIIGFSTQPSTFCSDSITPVMEISNFGTATLNSVTIQYTIDNGAPTETTWTGNLETHQSDFIRLEPIEVSGDAHTLTVYTTSPNGNADEFNDNDTLRKKIEVEIPVAKALPFSENFEGNFLPPKGWEIIDYDYDRSWTYRTKVEGPDGNISKVMFIEYRIYEQLSEVDELISPPVDLANTSKPVLSFDMAYARKSTTTNYDSLLIYVSTDCYHFTQVDAKGGTELATTTEQSGFWNPASTEWKKVTADLSAYAGEVVKIKLKAVNGLGHNLHIDNFKVDEAVASVDEPENFKVAVYPNPLKEHTLFTFSQFLEDYRLELYDIAGRQLLQKNISGRSFVLYRDKLPAGTLFFSITNKSSGSLNKGKLMIID